MVTPLLLAGLDNQHTLGEAIDSAEIYVRAYLASLLRYQKLKTRQEFPKLKEHKDVRSVLPIAAERTRAAFMATQAVETTPGTFVFLPCEHYRPITDAFLKT